MKQLLAILRKELKDSLRDRRSVFAALLVPFLIPLMLGVVFGSMAHDGKKGRPLIITLSGGERAPSLVSFLKQEGATIQPAPADFEALVRDGKLDAVVVVPEKYGEEFVSARPAKLKLVADFSRSSAEDTILRVAQVIGRYSSQVSGLRLLARGVSPEVAQAIDLQETDLSTQKSRSATLLGIIPTILMTVILIAGVYVAVDSTAGERERGSLEPLLLNPVPRQTLVSGKWLAVVAFTVGGFGLTLASILVVLNLIPLQNIGISLGIGAREVVIILLIALPFSIFISALELLLATFARTVREGQTYLSLLPLVPLLPTMLMEFRHVNPATWMSAIPLLGQQVLFASLMRGENGPPFGLFIAATVSVTLAVVCLKHTARLLEDEKIVLAR
ncbi:MAG TPA: ABC transporter permease [Candidatus Angelobacter sp.]